MEKLCLFVICVTSAVSKCFEKMVLKLVIYMNQKNCILLAKRVSYDPENKFGTVNISIFNNWKDSSVINFTAHYVQTVLKMKVAVSIMFPENENDQEYRRQFFQTTIDVNKIFSEVKGSFVIKPAMETFAKSLVDRVPHFPILAVRKLFFTRI